MGKIHAPPPVKIFTGILTSIPEILPVAEERLALILGRVDLRGGPFPFDATSYYDREMGTPITRHFVGFEELRSPAALAEIKVRTNELEKELGRACPQAPRPANLDPGYLEPAKIVLASTKNFYHRIFLSEGIYAEVTLHFENGEWRAFPWTFPDFRGGRYNDFFTRLRNRYRTQLRSLDATSY